MPVQQAEEVLNRFVREYLEERVTEETMATFSVNAVTKEFASCPEHEEPGDTWSAVVWQVHVSLVPVDPESEDKILRLNTIIPYTLLDGGDTGPLKKVLDQQWQDATFAKMMYGIDGELEQAEQKPEE